MAKLVKRLSEYTIKDCQTYCKLNGITYTDDIAADIMREIQDLSYYEVKNQICPKQYVTVTGYIEINHQLYQLLPIGLTTREAFDQMLTPDCEDYEVYVKGNTYSITCYHDGDNTNLFEFTIH